jgi:DNA-binding transcriptional MerR regulator
MSRSESQESLSIGEVARRAGVSARTIRLYEEMGILPAPERSAGGTRRYTSEYQFYIEGALLLKDVGFTLEELKLVGRLARGASMSKPDRRRAESAIAEKMQGLEHKIRVLQRLHEIFAERTQAADRDGTASLADLLETRPTPS